jgi:glycine dehydrogenase subunit 1
MGKTGMSKVASLCLDKAHYAAQKICSVPGYSMRFEAPYFKEFVIRTTKSVNRVLNHCRERNILAGVPLGPWYKTMSDCFLVAVTEKRSREEIDALAKALSEV